MNINSCLLKDAYKVSHVHQYPEGTTLIFNNFTPRKSRMKDVNYSVFFGLQYFIKKYLDEHFHDNFLNEKGSRRNYCHMVSLLLNNKDANEHIRNLSDLSYLPLAIYALPEGTVVPEGVPALVSYNTHSDYFWLPNMLETLLSCTLWGACTSATIAREYRLILDKYAAETSDMPEFVDYQAHDFSMRGMFGLEAAMISGMAHLHYFKGTDTLPAMLAQERYYDKPLELCSVPATEHSVMSAGGKENEIETYRRLLTGIHPDGMVSIVSDTWDLWNVVGNFLPRLKDIIMQRDGKLVIRPDSGDPVEILCGKIIKSFDDLDFALGWAEDDMGEEASNDCEGSYNVGDDSYMRQFKVGDKYYQVEKQFSYDRHDKTYYYVSDYDCKMGEPIEITLSMADKGLIECLWDIFGGTINSKGYKQLDPHIGAIYGDAISLERCREICEKLKQKGFASTNVVFGIGSYSYQYNTRDTLGWAIKATYAEINGQGVALTKDPVTDCGIKKSHSGLLKVVKDGDSLKCLQNVTWDEFNMPDNELKRAYYNGVFS